MNVNRYARTSKALAARWHHASRDVAIGVHATAGSIGTTTTASSNPISWGSGTECEVALAGSTVLTG